MSVKSKQPHGRFNGRYSQREKDQISWPVSFDGSYGPIARAWLINPWASTFPIDRRGLIHARNLRGPDLVKALEAAQRQ